MIIRKFQKEDAKNVSNLIRKCLIEVNSKDYSEIGIKFLCKQVSPHKIIKKSKERDIFVAVKNNRIIGTASLKENTILGVFVNPKNHGMGIGGKLMSKIENLAKKNGYKIIKLPSSLTAYEFYKKIGYKKIKILHSEDYGDTVEMSKKLY